MILFMKEGIIFGMVLGLLVYFMLPIYSAEGYRASLLPTGNVVDSPNGMAVYVSNLPFSTVTFVVLELLGAGLGAISQIFMKRPKVQG